MRPNAAAMGKPMTAKEKRKIREMASRQVSDKIPFAYEYGTSVNIAADPVVPYMTAEEMQRSIDRLREQMIQAAKEMEFIEAARLRDEIIKLEMRLEDLKS